MSSLELPLQGIRVVDLSRLVAGNMLSVVLADFGADVIKVERPGKGDDLRNWREGGIETWWKTYGRNKRSVALDLKCDGDLEILKSLIATAQVFIENFVPGKLEAMGLGPEDLQHGNPGLIIARVTGWGQTGPYRDRPGFGTLVEAMSGFAHLNGFPDKPPALPPLATADMVAGLYGAFAVVAALRVVEHGGPGQVIDLSLFESMFSLVASEAVKYDATGTVSMRSGNQSMHTAPRNVYSCADGQYIALSGSMQSMFERIARTIGREDLVDDPRFKTNDGRVRNRDALDAIIQDFMSRQSLDENLSLLGNAGVTVAPILSIADLMNHPYVTGRGVLQSVSGADDREWNIHRPVPRLSRTPGTIRRPAPEIGEHNAEIMAELKSRS